MPLPRRALSLAACAALVAGVGQARATEPQPIQATQVVAGPCTYGVTVPDDYVGLSIEWSMAEHWFGTSRLSAVAATVELLKSMNRGPSGGVLRIGGNSQDGYHWDPNGSTAHNTLFTGTI